MGRPSVLGQPVLPELYSARALTLRKLRSKPTLTANSSLASYTVDSPLAAPPLAGGLQARALGLAEVSKAIKEWERRQANPATATHRVRSRSRRPFAGAACAARLCAARHGAHLGAPHQPAAARTSMCLHVAYLYHGSTQLPPPEETASPRLASPCLTSPRPASPRRALLRRVPSAAPAPASRPLPPSPPAPRPPPPLPAAAPAGDVLSIRSIPAPPLGGAAGPGHHLRGACSTIVHAVPLHM